LQVSSSITRNSEHETRNFPNHQPGDGYLAVSAYVKDQMHQLNATPNAALNTMLKIHKAAAMIRWRLVLASALVTVLSVKRAMK
jgi:hypothetical protein